MVAASTHNLNGGNPSPTEFFILEYREKTGWDTYIGNGLTNNNSNATSGMCIWHIDYSAFAWNNNTVNNYSGTNQTQSSHMRVYLEPTNGLSQTTPGNAFTSGSFLPELWNGTDLIEIVNITKNGTTSMTFSNTTPVDNIYSDANLAVYPNPATAQVPFTINTAYEQGNVIKIYTVSGLMIQEQLIQSAESEVIISNPGVYIIAVGNQHSKVIVK